MRTSRLIITLSALSLSACTLAPDYERPAAPVPDAWPQSEAYDSTDMTAESRDLIAWRAFFRDESLQQLIALALENNRDLRVAALNVEAYRAQYRIQRSELFPDIGVDGSGSRQRLPADISPSGTTDTVSQYGLTIGTSAYELDLFGRVRSLNRAALENYLATEEARRGVHIGLVSDVALAWLALATDRELLALARATLDSYRESLELIETSEEAGVASALDVRQARTLVEQARADVARYTRREAQDINGLELLLGSSLPETLNDSAPLGDSLLADIPAGLPATLLEHRPDILAAERRLRAANADIGAARAAFFPSIRLTAAAGTASSELSGLFESGSETWNFAPTIHLPIFTAGRLRASLDVSELRRDMRVAEYENSIQTAFREVADGLAARGTYGEQIDAQRALVQASEEYTDLAQQRYDEGVDNYLLVLDARRALFTARQQLLTDRLAQLSSEVLFYKALGGGWL